MAFRDIGLGNISLADFSSENLVFVDKTPYIQKLEKRFLNYREEKATSLDNKNQKTSF